MSDLYNHARACLACRGAANAADLCIEGYALWERRSNEVELLNEVAIDTTIYVVRDRENKGFFVAYHEGESVARAKTHGMALAFAYAELGRRALEVERALRARMEPGERMARGL